jgi:tetratricopeptide (TPR) repeat protein
VARIYLSATYGDLKEFREKVYRALRQLRYDVIAMEDYVATDERPLAKCLEDVAACDLYIGIIAHRYGYIPEHDNPHRRSITELEYRHAQAHSIPRLVFLLDPAAPWLPGWMDAFTGDGDRGERIRALRDELGRERLVSFFATADELAQQISVAVTRQLVQSQQAPSLRVPHQLPRAADDFQLFGRSEVLERGHTILTRPTGWCLVHIRGEAGIGKTTTAVRLARGLSSEFPSGSLYIDLRGQEGQRVDPREALMWCIASLQSDQQLPTRLDELAAMYRSMLAQTTAVVVLDNAADEAQVGPLLPGAESSSAVIITSRTSLARLYIPPTQTFEIAPLVARDSIAMLEEQSGRRLDPTDEGTVRIMQRCAGLPFALSLVAAHLRAFQHLRPQDVALSIASPPLDEVSASTGSLLLAYRELSSDGARLFRVLTAFGLGAIPEWIVTSIMASLNIQTARLNELLNAKLVTASLAEPGYIRYLMHDLVVEFGGTLETVGHDHARARDGATAAHLRALVALQAAAEPNRFSYAGDRSLDRESAPWLIDEGQAIAALEGERLTTTAIFDLMIDDQASVHYIAMATTLPFCLIFRGTWQDWTPRVRSAIKRAEATGDWLAEAYLYEILQNLSRTVGAVVDGLTQAKRSAEIFGEHGHAIGRAFSMIDVALGYRNVGNQAECVNLLRETQRVFVESGYAYWAALSGKELGSSLIEAGEIDEAIQTLQKARDILVSFNDVRWETYTLLNYADAFRLKAARLEGGARAEWLTRATESYERIISWALDHSEWRLHSFANLGLAATAATGDEYSKARMFLDAALGRANQLGDTRTMTQGHLLDAFIMFREGQSQEAVDAIEEILPALRQFEDVGRVAQGLLIRGLARLRIGHEVEAAFDEMSLSEIAARVPALANDNPSPDQLNQYTPTIASWF